MAFNAELADRLETMARLLELTGANSFRVNAFARAARSVEKQTPDLSTLSAAQLVALEGVGKGIADKIIELARTGTIAELDALAAQVPAGLIDLLDIQGLGPKTVRLLWQERGITDRAGLLAAIGDGSILTLPRMGQKTVDNIARALTFASKSAQRLPLGVAYPIAERLAAVLRAVPGVTRVEHAGSLRRGKETIGDIDLLVSTTDPDAAAEAFCTAPGVTDVIVRGQTKCSVRVSAAADFGRWSGAVDAEARTVGADMRLIPEASFGAALMYFTGSKEHNVRLRERAQKKGLTLNEYGLFPEDNEAAPPQHRGIAPIAGATEAEVFNALGLPWIPPECREDAGELALKHTPRLVELADIKAELHAHTTASDGRLSLDALVEHAVARGFHTIAVTDHSRSSVQANGLSVERLREQRRQIEDARQRFGETITILHGCEVDILSDGSLDYDDDVLQWLDLVVASPHAALSQDPATATQRLLRAIEHPLVHIVGHPTGRLINKRPGLEPAMPELLAAAIEHDKAMEINAHWLRLDLRDTHVRAAVETGVRIAIDCDVHAAEDFDNLRYGVATARRGMLPPESCVNALPGDDLRAWIASKR
jgi:DNA polymerase (family 10)